MAASPQFLKGGAASAAGCVEGLHRFAQGATAASPLRVADCRSAAMLIKSALRNWLSVSYGMKNILLTGSLRQPPKGETAEWYMKYMTLCFSSPYLSFPLEGKSREAGKGVRGRAPIGYSIAILTANRQPVSFLLLTLRHACGVRVHRVQKGRSLGLTGPMGRRVLKFDGAFGPEGCGIARRAMSIKSALRDWLSVSYGMIPR